VVLISKAIKNQSFTSHLLYNYGDNIQRRLCSVAKGYVGSTATQVLPKTFLMHAGLSVIILSLITTAIALAVVVVVVVVICFSWLAPTKYETTSQTSA